MNLILFAIALCALQPEAVDLFNSANAAYQDGNYEQAISGYVQLQHDYNIKSPAIFFNLGNAWEKSGKPGKAILYYEAALAADPRFDPARQNLQTTLEKTKRKLPPPDPQQVEQGDWLHYYPFSPLQSLFLTHLCLFVALLLMLLRHWRDNTRLAWANRALPLLAFAFFVLTIAADYAAMDDPKLAVTVVAEAPVYFSMSESDSPRFLLYEGDRVLVDRIEGDWVRVNAYGGERGWTRKENAGIVEYSSL